MTLYQSSAPWHCQLVAFSTLSLGGAYSIVLSTSACLLVCCMPARITRKQNGRTELSYQIFCVCCFWRSLVHLWWLLSTSGFIVTPNLPNYPDFYILNWTAHSMKHVALRCGCSVPVAEWLDSLQWALHTQRANPFSVVRGGDAALPKWLWGGLVVIMTVKFC